eukprot:6198371-Pleurochrysis_carterae.AAC.1
MQRQCEEIRVQLMRVGHNGGERRIRLRCLWRSGLFKTYPQHKRAVLSAASSAVIITRDWSIMLYKQQPPWSMDMERGATSKHCEGTPYLQRAWGLARGRFTF